MKTRWPAVLLMILVTAPVWAQDGPFSFRKKNHKLNHNYLQELNQGHSDIYFMSTPLGLGSEKRVDAYVWVFPEVEKDLRFINPDAIRLRVESANYMPGKSRPVHLRPVGSGKLHLHRNPGVFNFIR